MRKLCAVAALLLITLPLVSGPVTFSGGYTRLIKRGETRELKLSENAVFEADGIRLTADTISLSGEDYRTARCSGNVKIEDSANNLTVRTPSVTYDRETGVIQIAGWVEIDDPAHELKCSAGNLRYDREKNLMLLESRVTLLKASGDDIIICKGDRLRYDRTAEEVTITGRAEVSRRDDLYRAHTITLDLESEAVTMDGEIEGVIHG